MLTIREVNNGWLLRIRDEEDLFREYVITKDEGIQELLGYVVEAVGEPTSRYSKQRLVMGVVPGDKYECPLSRDELVEIIEKAPTSWVDAVSAEQLESTPALADKLKAVHGALLELYGELFTNGKSCGGCDNCACSKADVPNCC